MSEQQFRTALKEIQDRYKAAFSLGEHVENSMKKDMAVISLANEMRMDPWHLIEEMMDNLLKSTRAQRATDK